MNIYELYEYENINIINTCNMIISIGMVYKNF